MPTTSNFGWTTPADTDLVKDGALAIRTLGNGIDTSMAQLKGGTTGQILSKTSNSDMAFTWINNDQGDITGITTGATSGLTGGVTSGTADLKLNTTAKGGLLVGTGSGTASELAVGTNGQVLTADSTTSTGLKWATPASGGKVLQVVMGTLTGITSTTSSTLVDLGLSVSITPSATTSKVLVIAGVNNIAKNSGNAATAMKLSLLRGATSIMVGGDRNGFNNTNVYSNVASATLNYLDSPSTTSATTYKIQFASSVSGQGVYVNDYDSSNTAVSTIMALEIGA